MNFIYTEDKDFILRFERMPLVYTVDKKLQVVIDCDRICTCNPVVLLGDTHCIACHTNIRLFENLAGHKCKGCTK